MGQGFTRMAKAIRLAWVKVFSGVERGVERQIHDPMGRSRDPTKKTIEHPAQTTKFLQRIPHGTAIAKIPIEPALEVFTDRRATIYAPNT